MEAYGEKGDAVQESSAGTDCHKLFVIELTSPCFLGCCVRYFCSFWFDKIKREGEERDLKKDTFLFSGRVVDAVK